MYKIIGIRNEKTESDASIEKNNTKFYKNPMVWFIIFLVLSLILNLHHELWRDESQSYLISKLGYAELFNQLRVEGHPFLWYFLLKIVNVPYEYLWIISWIITLISVYLILYKMNKPLLNKLVVIFSFPILYVSSVFARSYSIAILLVIILSIFYKKRYKYPLLYGIFISLLINTHVIFSGLVVSLMLIEIYKLIKDSNNRKNNIIIILICIIGIILMFIQLHGSINMNHYLFRKRSLFSVYNFYLFFSMVNSIIGNRLLAFIFSSIFIFLGICLVKYHQKSLLFSLILSCLCFIFIMSIYNLDYWVNSMMLIILLFIYWQCNNIRIFNCIFGVLFFCVILQTYNLVINDIKYNFSSAKMTSKYIKNNINEKEKIYCVNPAFCSSIIPYIDKYEFIDIKNNEKFTYVDWEKNTFNQKYDLNKIKDEKVKYVIISDDKNILYNENYKVIYKSEYGIMEKYIILKRYNASE